MTTTTAISRRQLQTAAELLQLRKSAFEYLRPGTEGLDPQSRKDRVGDVLYANEQLQKLADRIGISPAELVARAEAITEAESN